MKVKTNLRAGRQTQGADNTTTDASGKPVVVYYPPVTRCVGV